APGGARRRIRRPVHPPHRALDRRPGPRPGRQHGQPRDPRHAPPDRDDRLLDRARHLPAGRIRRAHRGEPGAHADRRRGHRRRTAARPAPPAGVTVTAVPLARSGALAGVPALELLADRPIDPGTALGHLFAPTREIAAEVALARFVADTPRRILGDFSDAASLLPPRERERAAILLAWVAALAATAGEADPAARRLSRLHRSAYLLARAL